MGSLLIRAFDARRQPLPDRMDVRVQQSGSSGPSREVRDAAGSAAVDVTGLIDHQPYVVTVRSKRHRPVSQFAIPRPGAPVEVNLYAPLDAAKAKATFPGGLELPTALRDVLKRDNLMYGNLSNEQKAGLFNVYAKMAAVDVWQAVERVTAVQPDRILCDVSDLLLSDDGFRDVDGSLHEPPVGFSLLRSFKTLEPYGNLQLTYFISDNEPLWPDTPSKIGRAAPRLKLDADIDDAAGLGHVFQVVGHWLTNGKTHPYDIHEILVWQDVTLPYTLA